MKKATAQAVCLFCLLLAQAAAAEKTAGNIQVLGDSLEYSAGVRAASSGGPQPSVDGGLSGLAHEMSDDGGLPPTQLESGFYSKLVFPVANLDYQSPASTGYMLIWEGMADNPGGTSYQNFASTWNQAGGYFVAYSTAGEELQVANLLPDASYYNFTMANYMEGDYSALAATTSVTAAAAVSSATFSFDQVGHNALALSFASSNPAPETQGDWADAADLPKALYAHAAVVYGSHVFVSGGFNGVYASSAVYRALFTPGQGLGAFEPAGWLPEGLYGHQMVAARGRIYVLGGRSQSAIKKSVWSAEVSSAGVPGTWQREEDMPGALYFHAAAAGGGRIYVHGGYGTGANSALYAVPVSSAGALDWLAAYYTDTSVPRYAHTLTFFKDRLYVVGGRDGAAPRSEVYALPLEDDGTPTGGAAVCLPLPAARYGHTALSVANALYILGGNSGGAALKTVFVSTLSAVPSAIAPWQAYKDLSEARQTAAGAAFGGELFLFGGAAGGQAFADSYTSPVTGTGYVAELSSDPAFAAELRSSGRFTGNGWSFAGLEPGLSYYARVKAVNRLGRETAYSAVAATVTYAAPPGTAAWTEVGVTSATVNWLAGGNAAATEYQLFVSSDPSYASPITWQGAATSETPEGLLPNTTYYAKVRVAVSGGGSSRFVELPTAYTSFDLSSDVSSPTITVNVSPAAMTGYQGVNNLRCDVDMADAGIGESGLKFFEVKSSTIPADNADLWVNSGDNIQGLSEFTQDWAVPAAVWAGVMEGTSNYISVRVRDLAGNTSTLLDAFSVLPDTTPPVLLVSTYAAPAGLQAVYPGPAGGLTIGDALSGLYKAEYSVSTNQGLADGGVVGWTLISTPAFTVGSSSYNPVIHYNFSALANHPSNYFSLRAVDVAGSTAVFTSVFSIGKLVSGPQVQISSPSANPYRLSTFTYVTGASSGTDAGVAGSELSLFDVTSAKYYSGSAFTAGSRVWFDVADDTNAYTFEYTFQDLQLTSGHQYELVARSSDTSGNYSQNFATYPFTFDTVAPDAEITSPVDGTGFSGASFSGSAADALSGIAAVQVAVQRLSDGKWWNGAVSWGASPVGADVSPAADWSWPVQSFLRDALLADGATYYVTARASDRATPANTGAFGITGSTFVYRDVVAPPATTALAAAPGPMRGSVLLSWPAAGDNGLTGYLYLSAAYRIAYSTYAAAPVSTATPQGVTVSTSGQNAGDAQTRLVTGLDAGTSYYFTLWTRDDAGNWSAASNEAAGEAGSLNTGALTGNVSDASTQAVTGVLVEALDAEGNLEGSDYTDPAGNYSIAGLNSELVSVRATWAASDVESSVSKDQVQNGAAGVNFRLSVAYQLAAISGTVPAAYLPKNFSAPSGARYTTREVRPSAAQPFAELYSRGRRIGAVFIGPDGAFEVPNLLPGRYGVRVYNGAAYSRLDSVVLRPGERLAFTPKFDLLSPDRVFAYPNPAANAVNFHFEPAAVSGYEARLEVFDIAGRLVKTLTSHENDAVVAGGAGRRFSWNLAGENVGSGVYLYILRIKDASGEAKPVIKKFAVVR